MSDSGGGSQIAGLKGETVGKVVRLGIQRVKHFSKDKPGRFKRTGERAGFDDLLEASKQGEDLLVDSASLARDLAMKAGGGKAPTLHSVPRRYAEQGFLPHYHPHGSKSHIFFEPRGGVGITDLLDMFGPVLILPFEQLLPRGGGVAAPPP